MKKMNLPKYILTGLFLVLFITGSIAQNTLENGEISGKVTDSLEKTLPLSSVAIYRTEDTALVSYGLANTKGAFHLSKVPFDIPLNIVISFTGYQSFQKTILLKQDNPYLVIGKIILQKKNELMEEVIITKPPPMRMNGDTLEFNADAFHVKKNGVVEDLIRQLPGVILWSDGKITVNGRQVSQVLVEGKPFFTGETKIATQNLPKEIIDKIQVYSVEKDKDSLLLSDKVSTTKTNMNIVLKKGKKSGYFGTLGGGYGNDGKYQTDISLGRFTPKTQLGAVFIANNTNKKMRNVGDVMKNTTYKQGGGEWTSYRSNFQEPGKINFLAGGANLTQEFSPKTNITGEYFGTNTNEHYFSKVNTITDLGNDKSQITNRTHKQHNLRGTNQLNGNFEYWKVPKNDAGYLLDENKKVSVTPVFQSSSNHYNAIDSSSTLDGDKQLLNRYSSQNITANTHSSLGVASAITLSSNANTRRSWSGIFIYNFNLETDKSDIISKSSLQSFLPGTPDQDQKYNRSTQEKSLKQTHNIEVPVSNFFPLLKINNIRGLSIVNQLTYMSENYKLMVNDFDENKQEYANLNAYLTNGQAYHNWVEKPKIAYAFIKRQDLPDRLNKNRIINIGVDGSFIKTKNVSSNQSLRFRNSYNDLLPHITYRYHYDDVGGKEDQVNINYTTDITLPERMNLVTLIDSSSQTSFYLGNMDLKKAYNHHLNIDISRINASGNRSITKSLRVQSGITDNKIIFSSFYDSLGRYISKPVNNNGYRFLNSSLDYQRGIKFKDHTINIWASASFYLSRNPSIINGQEVFFNYKILGTSFNISFSKNDLWEGGIIYKPGLNLYTTRNKSFKSTTQFSNDLRGYFQLFWSKRFTIDNYINYYSYKVVGTKAITSLIWVADLSYRFTKNDQFEIRAELNDILNQTKWQFTSYGANFIENGIRDRLMQYFLFKLIYHPRKFGLKSRI